MSLTNEDKDWINTQFERVETTLLTEFHKWAALPKLAPELTRLPFGLRTSNSKRSRIG
jgi:hypothetical protein